jgi:hypothetical protein
MVSSQRQWYPSSSHKSIRCPRFFSRRGLAFGIHDDANRDEPRKTTSVLNTDVEISMGHRAVVFIRCRNGCLCCECLVESDAIRQQNNVPDEPTLQNPSLVGLTEGPDVLSLSMLRMADISDK